MVTDIITTELLPSSPDFSMGLLVNSATYLCSSSHMGDQFASYLAESGTSTELSMGQAGIFNVDWEGQV